MEQAGVEPASENPSTKTSTIIAYLCLFPQAQPVSRRCCLGSFMMLLLSQSFERRVPRKVESQVLLYGSKRETLLHLGSKC